MINRDAITPLISLILPVYNEALSLPGFFAAVEEKLAGLKLELLFVDDGSSDDTVEYLRHMAVQDDRIRVIKFSRNFGKEAGLTAGLEHCRGDVGIPVDVDLQDPLEVVHDFIEKWREGYDVVHGVRSDRSDDDHFKRISASRYYTLFNMVSDLKMVPHSGDFRLLDRKAIEALKRLPERVRFMKGLFAWVGFRSAEVHYRRAKRAAGTSKFNATKLLRFGLDGLISFSSLPIQIWSIIGMLIAIPALAFMIFIIFKTIILGVDVPGYASLVTIVLFLGGIQLITLGIIGEYIGRIFTEVKARPVYIIEEEFGCANNDST